MTIYAIVNRLIARSGEQKHYGPIWTVISPSGILQGGNPYFVPDFASRFEARPALAVRIGKLGKGIARRFVSRYVDAVAPAAVFIASDLLQELSEAGLPWTSAISYDRCLAIGKFTKQDFESITECKCTLSISSTENEDGNISVSCTRDADIESIIEAISRDNTLKTGDIILIHMGSEGTEVMPGQRASLTFDSEESLRFNIR